MDVGNEFRSVPSAALLSRYDLACAAHSWRVRSLEMHSVFGCKSDKAKWMHHYASLSWLCILASTAGMSVVCTHISIPAEQLCAYHTVAHTLV